MKFSQRRFSYFSKNMLALFEIDCVPKTYERSGESERGNTLQIYSGTWNRPIQQLTFVVVLTAREILELM